MSKISKKTAVRWSKHCFTHMINVVITDQIETHQSEWMEVFTFVLSDSAVKTVLVSHWVWNLTTELQKYSLRPCFTCIHNLLINNTFYDSNNILKSCLNSAGVFQTRSLLGVFEEDTAAISSYFSQLFKAMHRIYDAQVRTWYMIYDQ